MSADKFHNEPFDESTLTKLRIFELYARQWLPVFLSREIPIFLVIHIYDFFAGPGTDSINIPGSPLRLLNQLRDYKNLPGWKNAKIIVHFYDEDPEKIDRLNNSIIECRQQLPEVSFDIQVAEFKTALDRAEPCLMDRKSAKLVLLDQYGVDEITPDVFGKLIKFPHCDFLFFLASSILYRFCDHPAIKQKIPRPEDYFYCHRAAFEYYKALVPKNKPYFLAPFSIKKGSNIYGLIFGSAHPLGMSKFLEVAWKSDEISGEANFDIDRQEIFPGQQTLRLDDESSIKKLAAFEADLESMLRSGQAKNELDVLSFCFEKGVRPQHASEVLLKLTREGILQINFRVPDVKRWKNPRPIELK